VRNDHIGAAETPNTPTSSKAKPRPSSDAEFGQPGVDRG
jgi:hypothetical protein